MSLEQGNCLTGVEDFLRLCEAPVVTSSNFIWPYFLGRPFKKPKPRLNPDSYGMKPSFGSLIVNFRNSVVNSPVSPYQAIQIVAATK